MTKKIERTISGAYRGPLNPPDPPVQDDVTFAPDKIEPLKIEEYVKDYKLSNGEVMKACDVSDALEALFAKVNEVIYKLLEKEE